MKNLALILILFTFAACKNSNDQTPTSQANTQTTPALACPAPEPPLATAKQRPPTLEEMPIIISEDLPDEHKDFYLSKKINNCDHEEVPSLMYSGLKAAARRYENGYAYFAIVDLVINQDKTFRLKLETRFYEDDTVTPLQEQAYEVGKIETMSGTWDATPFGIFLHDVGFAELRTKRLNGGILKYLAFQFYNHKIEHRFGALKKAKMEFFHDQVTLVPKGTPTSCEEL